MNPVDTGSLTGPVIAQWGAYGVILVVLALLVGFLGRRCFKSDEDRIADLKENLVSLLKSNADVTQALRDMRTTAEAMIAMLKPRT